MKRIVIDNYFHSTPAHRLSRNITTAGYILNTGRYSPFDVYHPNAISMLVADLSEKYEFAFSNEPFSEMSLCDADLLLIPNPDYPLYEGASNHRLDKPDVDAIMAFLNRGGRVLLLVNSFLPRSDFWEENFDYERVSLLFNRLGVVWDMDYMSDADRMLPARYRDMTIGYGQGGRVFGALPDDAEPLLSCEGDIFGFCKKVGRGEIAVIGDAGSISNGLYGFPTFENRAFILDLLDRLLGESNAHVDSFEYMGYGMLSCGTSETGLTESLFRKLCPDAEFIVDHHYRHLVWEKPSVPVERGAVSLPFDPEDLRDKDMICLGIPRIAIQPGLTTGILHIKPGVTRTVCDDVETYFISGNAFEEDLQWEDIGADPEVFGSIGVLSRVNTVVQYMLGMQNGKLKWASSKQGQILYARNPDVAHYGGFNTILLASDCAVYSPIL